MSKFEPESGLIAAKTHMVYNVESNFKRENSETKGFEATLYIDFFKSYFIYRKSPFT